MILHDDTNTSGTNMRKSCKDHVSGDIESTLKKNWDKMSVGKSALLSKSREFVHCGVVVTTLIS